MFSFFRLTYPLLALLIPCSVFTISLVPVRSISSRLPISPPTGWQYESKSDKLTGTLDKATLPAANSVQFPYPYAGGSTVSLVLRHRNGQTNAYLSTSKGIFTNSFQGGRSQIRFDGGRPVTYALTAAANGSGNPIFFDADQQLIRQIRASKTMTVRVQCPGLSLDELRFNTAGLRWNH